MPRHTVKRKAGRKHKKSRTMKRHHKGGFFGPLKGLTDAAAATMRGATKKVTDHPAFQKAKDAVGKTQQKISDSTRKVLDHPAVQALQGSAQETTRNLINQFSEHANNAAQLAGHAHAAIQAGAKEYAGVAASKAAELHENMMVVGGQIRKHAATVGENAGVAMKQHVDNVQSMFSKHLC